MNNCKICNRPLLILEFGLFCQNPECFMHARKTLIKGGYGHEIIA